MSRSGAACIGSLRCCHLVSISEPQTQCLSQVLYKDNPVASASATTTVVAGGACVLALDEKSGGIVPANPPSVSISGRSILTLRSCHLVNNLNDPGANKDEATVTGTSILQAIHGREDPASPNRPEFFAGARAAH